MIDLEKIERNNKIRFGEFVFLWLYENYDDKVELQDDRFLAYLYDSILDNNLMFYLYINDNLTLVDYDKGRIVFEATDDDYSFLEGALFK